jgi:putative ABC transport system permease protein
MNNLKNAWRNILNQKIFSLINISGLSLGMAAASLILLWVNNEFRYDQYQPDAYRIYRVGLRYADQSALFGGTPLPLAELAKQEIPGIDKITRYVQPNNANNPVLNIHQTPFREKNVVFVDKEWFSLFHYDFVEGHASDFIQQPCSIILTRSLAKKYYGNKPASGEMIRIDSTDYKVQAVVADYPSNSSFRFEVFLPLEAYLADPQVRKMEYSFRTFACETYIHPSPNLKPEKLASRLTEIFQAHQDYKKTTAFLTPLPGLHFDGEIGDSTIGHEDKKVVLIFAAIGIILLAIACINYVNLSTARVSLRTKEIGIRKILGADRKILFIQFMTESILTSLIAFIVTLIIIRIVLPYFNRFTDQNFQLSPYSLQIWEVMGSTLLLSVLLTGIYPALLLSSFKPLNLLKGLNLLRLKNKGLRRFLVVSQFTITVALIVGTIVIFKQLHFILQNNEGYNRSEIFSLAIPHSPVRERKGEDRLETLKALKQELSREPAIERMTTVSDVISNLKMSMSGIVQWPGKSNDFNPVVTPIWVDPDFLNLFQLQVKEGRWFLPGREEDRHNYILNETAVKEFGLAQPIIGQLFIFSGDTGRVLGVVKDFHFSSYREKIGPVVLLDNGQMRSSLFIKVSVPGIRRALDKAEGTWKEFFPGQPFEYHFMDDEFEQLYRSDIKTSTLLGLFAGIAVMISCLGLFGLSLFTAQQRTREVSIRKVLGAGALRIAFLLSADFVKLVGIAILIGSPLAWWAMNKWLQDFAYRIHFSAWIFALAGSLAIFIALVTVSFQAIKSAVANPIKNLKNE